MNMNGTPSAYSQVGTPSSFSQMSMTPNSMMDGRSPHFVRGQPAFGKQIVTAPDVGKLGEDLVLRASSADDELKRRLKSEQYDIGGHFVKVDGINPNATIVVAIRLADDGSCEPWLENAHEEHIPARALPLQSKLHDLLGRNDIEIQVPPPFARFFMTTFLTPLYGGLEGRISGNGAIRTPKAYAVRSPKGTPPTRSPITTPRHAGARTPGGSTVRTPTHKGLLVRTPTGESIIRTPTQNRDSFFKPPPLQMIATGLNRSPSTKSMGPDTPGGYSPFGMPPPPTWAMNEPLTPQNKLPPLRVPAALKNDSYAPSQTALSGHAGGGAPTTPEANPVPDVWPWGAGGSIRGPRSGGGVVRTPGGVKPNDPRGQQGVTRNAITRVNNRATALQNGAQTGGVMPNFGSRSPKFQETDEEKLEREATLLLAAASGALKGTSGALKGTSGALKGTSGALKNANRRTAGGGRLSQDTALRAVNEDGEVDLNAGVALGEGTERDSVDNMFVDLDQNVVVAAPIPMMGNVADMARTGLDTHISPVPNQPPQPNAAPNALRPAPPLTRDSPTSVVSSGSDFYEPEGQYNTLQGESQPNPASQEASVPPTPPFSEPQLPDSRFDPRPGTGITFSEFNEVDQSADNASYKSSGAVPSYVPSFAPPVAAAKPPNTHPFHADQATASSADPPDMPSFQSNASFVHPPDMPPFQSAASYADPPEEPPFHTASALSARSQHSAARSAQAQQSGASWQLDASGRISADILAVGAANTPPDIAADSVQSLGSGEAVASRRSSASNRVLPPSGMRTMADALRDKQSAAEQSMHADSHSIVLHNSARGAESPGSGPAQHVQHAQHADSLAMDGMAPIPELGADTATGSVRMPGVDESNDGTDLFGSADMHQPTQSGAVSAAVTGGVSGEVPTISTALRRLQASVQASAGAVHAPVEHEQQQSAPEDAAAALRASAAASMGALHAAAAPPQAAPATLMGVASATAADQMAELRAAMTRSAAAQQAALASEHQAAAEIEAENARRVHTEHRAAQAAAAAAEQERLQVQEAELRREADEREAEQRVARRLKDAKAEVVHERATSDAAEVSAAAHTHAAHARRMSSQDSEAVSSQAKVPSENQGPIGMIPLEPLSGASAVCLVVVGTRGDVQPFLAIARELRRYGHRVRIATHSIYREFVEDHSVEFYPLPGSPSLFADFIARKGTSGRVVEVVKDSEGVPAAPPASLDEVTRKMMWSMFQACTEPDPEHPLRHFRASAIISNPRAFGSLCCAERLKIPLHLMSLMATTPTTEFHHPMSVVQSINMGVAISGLPNDIISGAANYFSYKAFDLHLWQGVAGHISAFRKHLGLPQYPSDTNAPAHALQNLRIPISYLWSPTLLPKPKDWGNHVQVCGNVTVDLQADAFRAPPPLATFLDFPNPPPVYIGFGALAIPDPVSLTELIYDAAKASGKRVLLSRGCADLGKGVEGKPDNVCLIGNCPHSWLFPKCSAAIHHGSAGTTAAVLRAGIPSLVVPVCGDQQFWGDLCSKLGVGPRPVPITRLRRQDLLAAFSAFERPEMKEKAAAMGEDIATESGVDNAVRHFHACLKEKGRILQPGACSIDGLYVSKMPMKDLVMLPPGAPVSAATKQHDHDQVARARAAAAAAAAVEAARLQAQKKPAPWYSCLNVLKRLG